MEQSLELMCCFRSIYVIKNNMILNCLMVLSKHCNCFQNAESDAIKRKECLNIIQFESILIRNV